jgi:hypothetical protein
LLLKEPGEATKSPPRGQLPYLESKEEGDAQPGRKARH